MTDLAKPYNTGGKITGYTNTNLLKIFVTIIFIMYTLQKYNQHFLGG